MFPPSTSVPTCNDAAQPSCTPNYLAGCQYLESLDEIVDASLERFELLFILLAIFESAAKGSHPSDRLPKLSGRALVVLVGSLLESDFDIFKGAIYVWSLLIT